MKNFTNNFKQFTSRLSARWLIMAQMLLLGTSSAWGAYYVTGNVIGNWSDGANNRLEMTSHESDVVKAQVSQGGDFKIHYAATGWDNDWYKTIQKGTSTGATITGNDNGSNLNLTLQSGYSFPVTIYFDPYGNDGKPYVWAIATTGGSGGDGTKIQLAGSFNDWGNSTDICYSVDNSTCSFEKELSAGKYEFKIIIDGTWYSQKEVTVDGSKVKFQNPWNANSSFNASKDGIYTFYVDKEKQVWITYRAACKDPKASDFTYTEPNDLTYSNSAKSATVSWNGTQGGDITIYYKNGDVYSEEAPSAVGEYEVYVTTTENNNFCALTTKTKVGSFIIECTEEITKDKFSYTLPTDAKYTGNPHEVSVNWESGTTQTNGAITVYYKKGEGVYENQAPTLEGTYTVAAKVTTAGNYCVSKNYIELSQFEISLAEQEDFDITTSLSVCGATITLSATGGSGEGDITYTIGSTNTANARIEGGTLMATISGSVEITATKAGEEGKYKPISSTKTITITIPEAPFRGVAQSTTICAGSPFSYNAAYNWYTSADGQEKVSGSANLSETTTYYISQKANNCESARTQYTVNVDQPLVAPTLTLTNPTRCKDDVKPGSIVIDNYSNYDNSISFKLYKGDIPTGIPYENGYAISEEGSYKVEMVTTNSNVCGQVVYSDIKDVSITNNTPTITDVTISGDTEVCINTGTTLTCNVTAENYDEIAYLWSNGATAQSIQTGDLAEDKTFTVTVTARKGECEVTESKSFEISIIPLSEPAVSVIASSGVESVNLTINLTTDGCGKNFIYGYRYKLSDEDDTAFIEKEIESTSSNAVSTIIENLITGKEYIIQAYVVNVGFNNNQKYYTEEVTCTVMAAEDCTADSDVDYIEILCRNESTGGRDMNCYAYTSSGTPLLGAWPGSKTDEGDHKYNGTDYAYWKLDATEASIVFNYGTDEKKTGDIEGLEKGKRYVFTINSSNNYTKKVDGENIYEPEVETVSITPIRNQSGTVNVTMIGKVIKRGCSDIVWYGFQSKTDNGNWTDIKVAESNLEAGSTYSSTKSYSNNHTYSYRAKLINANGTKVYGEPISFYAPETDVNIAEVGNDTDVNTTIYYDFVGLYVNSILKPSDVKVESYTWKLNGNTYIDATSITDLYGNTNLITTNGSNNIRPNKTGNYTCEVLLENGVTLTSNTITITSGNTKGTTSPIITRENRTLPVISVKTNKVFPVCEGNAYPSAQASKLKKKRSVDVKIFDAEGRLYYDRKARMNYRGSSSLNFVKKSYAFCPGDADCGDNKDGADYVKTVSHNMFDLGASDKDWVLYAAAADPSMMRNRISFETYFNMTNKWGVKTMYVELIVDGEYKGVYVFMDKITNNIDRVDITAADGFIVKFDKTDVEDRYEGKTEDQKTFATSRTGRTDISTYGTTVDQLFEIEYPEKDVLGSTWNSTVTQIQNKFEEFETALAEGRYETVRTIIDYESWADWFIFNEYSKNQDAYRASCIFVYNGDKIEARPLWDQELSFNNQCRTSNGSSSTTGLLINNDGLYTDCFPAPFWFTGRNAQFGSCGGNNGESTEGTKYENYLLKDACFISMIKQRWAYHTAEGGALSKAKISNLFTTFSAELEKSQEGKESEINSSAVERENSYWNGKTRATAECGGNTGYSNTEYSVEKTNLIEWIEGNREKSLVSREENLATEIGKLKGETMAGISLTLNPANGITTPWMPLTVTVNVEEGVEYNYDDTSITEGISDAEKARITKSGNKYKYLFPRPTDWGEGNVDTALEQKVYPITVGLKVIDTQCPGINNEASAYIKLTDEGNDICE